MCSERLFQRQFIDFSINHIAACKFQQKIDNDQLTQLIVIYLHILARNAHARHARCARSGKSYDSVSYARNDKSRGSVNCARSDRNRGCLSASLDPSGKGSDFHFAIHDPSNKNHAESAILRSLRPAEVRHTETSEMCENYAIDRNISIAEVGNCR